MEARGGEKEILVTPTQFRTPIHHGLDAESRIRMAEEVAVPRNLIVSPALRAILSNNTESFFHQKQQSTQMLEDFQNRQHISYKTMREAVIKLKEDSGQQLPNRIPMLDVNPTRITLSLEIEFQYHELMHKRIDNVENVTSIMHSTNTLIQLPDKLNVNGASPHAQQVTITGFFNDVENARIALRENCPLSVYLEIDASKNNIDHVLSYIESNRNTYDNVTIELDNLPNSGPGLKLTCRQKHIECLNQACENISSMLNNNMDEQAEYSMRFNISVYHLDHVVGKPRQKYMLMPLIEQRTGTKITHPSFDAINTSHDHIFPLLIRGRLNNVLEARKCITELLPVSMCLNINDSDMAQPIDNQNRVVDVYHSDMKVSMRVTPSRYDPVPLLADEELQHCITLRTKEFNMHNLYTFYTGLLSSSIKLDIPEIHELQSSVWLKEILLDDSVMTFKLPCRGEAPMPDKNSSSERHRTTSLSLRKHDKVGEEGGIPLSNATNSSSSRRHSSSTSYMESLTPSPSASQNPPPHQQQQHPPSLMPTHTMPFIVQPGIMQNPRYLQQRNQQVPPHHQKQQQQQQQKNQSLMAMQLRQQQQQQQQQQQPLYVYPYIMVPQSEMFPYLPFVPDMIPYQFHPGLMAAAAQQAAAASSSEQPQERRGSTSSSQGQRTHQNPPQNHRPTYQANDGRRDREREKDEPVVGSYEDSERSYYNRQQRPNHRENWRKNDSGESSYYPKKGQQSMSTNNGGKGGYRGNQQHNQNYFRDRENGQDGGNQQQSHTNGGDQQQFTSTHTLKLKQVIPDEQDRFFTQDVSHVAEEKQHNQQLQYSPRKQFRRESSTLSPSLNTSFDYGGARSRTMSMSYERDENNRYENEKMYHGDDHGYRKSPNSPYQSVTKTMLEPRTRHDKPCQIINLERKDKVPAAFLQPPGGILLHENEGIAISTDSENGGSNSKVMEFMKIVTQQQQQQQQQQQNIVFDMQNNKNRTYAEILKEREWGRQQQQHQNQQQKERLVMMKMSDIEGGTEEEEETIDEKQLEDANDDKHRIFSADDIDQNELRLSSSAPTLLVNMTSRN